MTINEFRAWLEGFEESFARLSKDRMEDIMNDRPVRGPAPDAEQWARIKQKLSQVEPVPHARAVMGSRLGAQIGQSVDATRQLWNESGMMPSFRGSHTLSDAQVSRP